MNNALETLFFALENDTEQFENKNILFLNSMYHRCLQDSSNIHFSLFQHFRPYAQKLEDHGFEVCSSYEEVAQSSYGVCCLLLPKNMQEARYLIAVALRSLCTGGVLFCAADNKAGGSRLQVLMREFGFGEVASFSRNKARAVRVCKGNQGLVDCDVLARVVEGAIEKGGVQSVIDGRFVSRPGVYGWNKIDEGSKILAQCLPSDFSGRVADFGCGYGYLSDVLLVHNAKIEVLHCVDADQRALDVCALNLQKYDACEIYYHWLDLGLDLAEPRDVFDHLDCVVMNPPFHEGKKTDIQLGRAFIVRAHESLRKGGRLWMVANAHLAYEAVLKQHFRFVDRHYEGQGFKVYEGIK
ncbi:MAG: methyltransferase [Alphaproteobacteria bacterium]